MLPLLAPVLAQIITLGVHDRTEARYLNSYDERFEASTTPGVELNLDWRRYQLTLGYEPSFLITPLEDTPRELLVYHQASIETSYKLKHTTFSLGTTLSFGDVNFQLQALQTATPLEPDEAGGQAPDGQTPDGGDTGEPAQPQPNQPGQGNQPGANGQVLQPNIEDRVVRYGTWATNATVSHDVSKQVQASAFASYTMAGALDESEREQYPLTRGFVIGATASHTQVLGPRDGLVSSLSVQQAFSDNGNRALSGVAREQWGHRYNKQLSSYLGAGLSVTRFSQDNGLVAISVFPDVGAGLGYQRLLARGTLSLSLGAFSTPVLDPLRATVDPRVGASGSIGWSRDKFSNALSGGVAFSTAPQEVQAGAFDSYQASYVAQYQVSKWVALDAGARLAMQQYQAVTTVPFSYAGFVGVTFGYAIPLTGNRRP